MKYERNKALLLLSFIAVAALLLTAIACEPAAPIKIKNDTDQILTIFIYDQRIGDVKPGEEIINKVVTIVHSDYLIEAKDVQGNIVYSKEFSYKELEKTDWKLVIPPLE